MAVGMASYMADNYSFQSGAIIGIWDRESRIADNDSFQSGAIIGIWDRESRIADNDSFQSGAIIWSKCMVFVTFVKISLYIYSDFLSILLGSSRSL